MRTLAVCAVLALLPAARAGEPLRPLHLQFANGQVHPIAISDVNVDGLPDLVGKVPFGLVVRLAIGGGEFGPTVLTPQTANDANIGAIGDLDGDGVPDALWFFDDSPPTSGAPEALRTLRGQGDGTFVQTSQLLQISANLGEPVLADFDGDGVLDAAVASFGTDLRLYHGLGDGSMDEPQIVPVTLAGFPLQAGDLDLDGDPDLALRTLSDGIVQGKTRLVRNDPPGIMDPAQSLSGYYDIALADVTGDGITDLVGTKSGLTTAVHVAGPFGLLVSSTVTSITTNTGAEYLETGDMDGDGVADLVLSLDPTWSSVSDQLTSVMRANGSGGFLPAQKFPVPGAHPQRLGDVDGDGLADVVSWASSSGSSTGQTDLVVLRGDGAGGLLLPPTLPGAPETWRLAAADFTGDGRQDVIGLAQDADVLRLFPADGTGGLLPAIETGCTSLPREQAPADFDGDGDMDVAVATNANVNSKAVIDVLLNDGTGDLSPAGTAGLDRNSLAAVDVDGDGLLDLVAGADGTQGHGLLVSLGDGAGGFAPAALHAEGDSLFEIACADLDLDGDVDVAARDNGDETDLLRNDGGIFMSVFTVPGFTADAEPLVIELDGDGLPDLVMRAFGLGLQPLINAGNLAFTPGPIVGGLDLPGHGQVADLDGDGLQEIVGAEAFGWIEWLEADGQGSLVGVARTGAACTTTSFTVIQFDDDPELEMLAGTGAAGLFTLLQALPQPTWQLQPAGLAGAQGVPVLHGDGTLLGGSPATLALSGAAPFAPATIVIGLGVLAAPFKGGVLYPQPDLFLALLTDGAGTALLQGSWPVGLPAALAVHLQAWVVDAGGPKGLAATPGLLATTP